MPKLERRFRSDHSSTLQLIRVLHYLASEKNCGRYTVAVLLDVEKAFDRFLRYCQRGTIRPRPFRAVVPQGSCLSSSLYEIYTDDIPTLRGHLEDWEDDVMLVLYANDSAYYASPRRADQAARKIQRVFNLTPEWLDKRRMTVNISRTTGSQRIMLVQLHLRGQDVEIYGHGLVCGSGKSCALRQGVVVPVLYVAERSGAYAVIGVLLRRGRRRRPRRVHLHAPASAEQTVVNNPLDLENVSVHPIKYVRGRLRRARYRAHAIY
ncbi:RNA-directed DNA polymerase from mobile element jockey [Eumeta japonica]|uniref:RNA-directed DNA polymerase from mobile element jockey n=1 Tax=Eumeta variegata TaxID=151549 RepID=A0A4C1ZXQ4_EUMVA|nr:RNA-directed DNA polymerase from mobile element jockey [Eumeta japonica]